MKKFLEKFYLVLIFIFLYAPILTLIVLSFNESRSMGSWSVFTLKWYAAMLQDETMMEALKNTLVIALVSAVTATLIGTLACVAIQKMKPGALLVNTARGGLVDTQAVYEALQNRKLGGFAMDVYEYENLTARKDYRGKPLDDSLLSKLLAMDQVLFTTHTAFYTDQAIENIVESSLQNLASFFRAGESENEI